MKSSILIPIITFVAGGILVMILTDRCNDKKIAELTSNLSKYKDSTKAIVQSRDSLQTQVASLSFEKMTHDSTAAKTTDSLKNVIKTLKSRYYADTVKFKKIINDLQDAFDKRDSGKAQAAIDSLVIEARSANWSAGNLFSQYEELDSSRASQKAYDDSVYLSLLSLDREKDKRFNALLMINNKMGDDYQAALVEIQKLKTGKKFWFGVGVIIGALTNFIHK